MVSYMIISKFSAHPRVLINKPLALKELIVKFIKRVNVNYTEETSD